MKRLITPVILVLVLILSTNVDISAKKEMNCRKFVSIEVVEYRATKPFYRNIIVMEKKKAEQMFRELRKAGSLETRFSILRSYNIVRKGSSLEKFKKGAEIYAKNLGVVDEKGNILLAGKRGLMFLGYIAAIGNGTVFLAKGSIDDLPRPHLLLFWRFRDTLFSAAGVFGKVLYRGNCVSRGSILGFFGYCTYVKNPPRNWRERTGVVLGFFAVTKYVLKGGADKEKRLIESNLKEFRSRGKSFCLTTLNNKIIFNPYTSHSFDIYSWFDGKCDTIRKPLFYAFG